MKSCKVCLNPNLEELYRSRSSTSITTMSDFVQGETRVFACQNCSHLQTKPLFDPKAYYQNDYEINASSLDHDQLYAIEGKKNIYRNEHQSRVLLDKLKFETGLRILDYGCGNGLTLKHLLNLEDGIEPFAFDVTDKYKKLWAQFLPESNFATFVLPNTWEGSMDVVTSFFALEHVEDPGLFVAELTKYLKKDGSLYIIVPNLYENFADLLVADHINHFSEASLYLLLRRCGFQDIIIDSKSHNAALIAVATNLNAEDNEEVDFSLNSLRDNYLNRAQEISSFWSTAINNMKEHLNKNKGCENIIYGAGVYGSWMHQYLSEWDTVKCFVDNNVYVHGSHVSGLRIFSPEEISMTNKNVWFGLSPKIAAEVALPIAQNANFSSYFYFEN